MQVTLLMIIPLGPNFTNTFATKTEQLLRRLFLMISTATEFSKIGPEYGARHKS
jgi:hypothetical protein